LEESLEEKGLHLHYTIIGKILLGEYLKNLNQTLENKTKKELYGLQVDIAKEELAYK